MLRKVTWLEVVIDFLIAIAIVGPLTLFDLVLRGGSGNTLGTVWVVALGLLLGAMLTVRRFAPVPVVAATLVLSAVHVLLLQQDVYAVWFAVLVPLATVGRFAERRRDFWITGGIIVLAAALVSVSSVRVLLGFGSGGTEQFMQILGTAVLAFVPSFLLFAGAVLAGVVLRLIVKSNREARERREAERSVLVQMELRAAEEERTAIARDMHDVVAHSLAVVIAQADGGRYTVDPERKNEVLQTISATAREALTDVRGLLHQLRHSQAAEASMGSADIEELVERMRASGLQATLDLSPTLAGASRPTQVAAYRIVQEALTNAMRHGMPGTQVPVRVSAEPGAVIIEVHSRPKVFRPRADAAGHGIQGMRERAALTGGSTWIGFDRGWFRVHARLPLEVET